MRLLVILPALLLLSACSTVPIHSPPEVIKVPVVQEWPEPPVIPKPDLEITHVDSSSPYDIIAKSTVITIKQLTDYSDKLSAALDAYRHKK